MRHPVLLIFFSAATALMLDLPPMTLKMKLVDIAKEVKSLGIFGPFHPKFGLAHVMEQPIFRIPNLEYLQLNFCFDFFDDSENTF